MADYGRALDEGEMRTMRVHDDFELLYAPWLDFTGIRPADVERASVTAYALRWAAEVPAETVDGGPCWVRYNERAFHDQFFSTGGVIDDPPLLMLGHGWGPRRGSTRGGIRHPLGQVVEVRADPVGLWTRCMFWDVPRAREVRDLMASGRLSAFSSYVIPERSVEIGERDGAPVFEVTEGWLIETGPTHEPADERAIILTVGGWPVEDRSEVYASEARGREMVRSWLSDPDEMAAVCRAAEDRRVRTLESAAAKVEGLARAAKAYAAMGSEDRAREALDELVDRCGDAELARDVLAAAGVV